MALATNSVPLQDLPLSTPAEVADVFGSDDEVARLAELGLHNGAVMRLVRQGSPCIFQVNNSRICLRPSNLQIYVTPLQTR